MRIAIVGAGNAGLRHLALARELKPNADIRILAHSPPTHVPMGASENLASLDELAQFRPNMAVIATPATHRLAALQVLAGTGVALLIALAALTAAGAAAAYFGKAEFAASFAENALAGRFWHIGWIVTATGAAGLITAALLPAHSSPNT